MKSLKELKKMDVFKKLLDDPGDTKNILAAKMAWQKLVMNEELPVELKKNNSLKGFIQDLLKIDVSFGLEMLKQEQEKALAEQDQDQEQEEGHEEEVTDGTHTIVITNPKAQIKELQDQVSEKDEALKKLQESLREIDKTAKEDLQRAAEGYKTEAEKLKKELKDANIFKARFAELQELLNKKTAEIETLQEDSKKLKEENSRLIKENGDLKSGNDLIANLEKQINEMPKKTKETDPTLSIEKMSDTHVLKNLAYGAVGLDSENRNLNAKIKELEYMLTKDADAATEAFIEGLKKDKTELHKALETANAKIAELGNKECDGCKELGKQIADKDEEIKQLNEDLEETTKKLEAATSAVGSAQANTQRLEKEAVKPLKENLLKAKKLIEKYEGEIKVLKEEKTALEKKIQELQEQIDKGKSKMDGLEKLQNDLLAAELALKNRDEDLKKKDKELQQALEREEVLKKATNVSALQLKSHDAQLQQKDEEIGILEEKIKTLEKQGQEKAAAENEKPVDFTELSHSIEVGELEEKLTKFEKRARKAPIFGKLALIPPLFLLFFPFTPKRSWTGWRLVYWPIGTIVNLMLWLVIAYGGLNATSHFIAPAEPKVKDVTVQAFGEIEKQAKNAGIYYSINSGAVNADPGDKISKALGEKDKEFEEKLKLYVLKTEAEVNLKNALADNNASWTEKLKLYVLKDDSDVVVSQTHKQWDTYYKTQETAWSKIKAGLEQQLAEAQEKAKADLKALADNDASWTEKLKLYVLITESEAKLEKQKGAFDSQRASFGRQIEANKKAAEDAALANKSLTEKVGKLEGEASTLKQQLAEAKKTVDTVNDDLKAEKGKASVLINEKAVLKQTADLVPGLNQQLDSLKVYKPAIDEIKIILMDEQGFIDCPTDKPDGSMNWYVNSFLKRGYSVSQKVQLQKTGLIVVHYSGASLIRDYKGTKYYLVVKAETPPQKK